mmetsp:Transcript_833/g.1322  ORF Transcript_833/g.1322 Transcript_833/m.1322 type:complete len:971 (+) Transcript_833:90-3002(+)
MASTNTQRARTNSISKRASQRLLQQQKAKEAAKQAAQDAASRAIKGAVRFDGSKKNAPNFQNHQRPCYYGEEMGFPHGQGGHVSSSVSVSVGSISSLPTIERAVHRGFSRGSSEMNERTTYFAEENFPDMDMTTYTEETSNEENTKSSKKRRRMVLSKILKRNRKGESHSSRSSSGKHHSRKARSLSFDWDKSDFAKDAWMCGCCGKVFSNEKAAELHEDRCIYEAIHQLEWSEGGLGWAASPTASANTFPLHAMGNPGASTVPSAPSHFEAAPLMTTAGDYDDLPPDNFLGRQPAITFADNTDLGVPSFKEGGLKSILRPSKHFFRTNGSDHTHSQQQPQQPHAPMPTLAEEHQFCNVASTEDLLLTHAMRQFIVLTDEALVNTVERAEQLVVTNDETDAERELMLLGKDKEYYDMLETRTNKRNACKNSLYTHKKGILSKVQNKFADAYTTIKEGDMKGSMSDQYSRTAKGKNDSIVDIQHDDKTLYVNVIVKNSIRVVSNELERLANARWEASKTDNYKKDKGFAKFREMAQLNVVKLAGLALASDFTPRRIAVQLSNDLYRRMAPGMKKRGVTIETEIEYRVGPFFVLAVNVQKIDWIKLIKFTHKDVQEREKKWREELERNRQQENESTGEIVAAQRKSWSKYMYMLCQLTRFEIFGQFLSWIYHVHWIISLPICTVLYVLIPSTVRTYLLQSVTDEIFTYIEEKGMEMEIGVKVAKNQAAFMLSALRELRADDRDKKKKEQESKAGEKGAVIGPLLGPAIKADKGPAEPPQGFSPPENLEFVGLDIELPVGFRRLRWAILSTKSRFMRDAVWSAEAKYSDINKGEWSHHKDEIGLPELPDGVSFENLIGAEQKSDYLMPKSAFVKANTSFETANITYYDDHCFVLKKKAHNPDVPYGSTFLAHTQMVVINTGNETCRMICSTEAEFPNGPPMVSRQIKSGMRAGTALLFVLIGETICKYADEYP